MNGDANSSGSAGDDVIVAILPVLGVELTHVAEARRALLAQGREVSDTAATRLLWVARALPAALDVLVRLGGQHAREDPRSSRRWRDPAADPG
mgnify:CR=1 FL=1